MLSPLAASHVLALLGGGAIALSAVLAGVWLGFRICTRDAALLARFATDAREARLLSDLTSGQAKVLREEWEAFADSIERKRKQIGTAAARAERAQHGEEAPPQVPMTLSDRRRLVARRMNGRA